MEDLQLPPGKHSGSNLVVGMKIALIIAATLVIFYPDLRTLTSDVLQNPFASYVLAIPFLFSYLIYRKRRMFGAVMRFENENEPEDTKHFPTIAGVLLCLIVVLLHWYGSYTVMPIEYQMFAFPVFVAGLSLILFNTQTLRQLAFPLTFLIFLTPSSSGIFYTLGSTLSIATFIAYIIRGKPWEKIVLLVIGIPAIYLALQAITLPGSWMLVFLGTFLLLAVSEKIFRIQIFGKHREKCAHCNPAPKTNYAFCFSCGRILEPKTIKLRASGVIKLVSVVFALILLTLIPLPVFALTQESPMTIISVASGPRVTSGILPNASDYNLNFLYRDTHLEATSKQDMALVYVYTPLGQSNQAIWATIEIAPKLGSLHRWEETPGLLSPTGDNESTVSQIELKDIELAGNPNIVSRYFVFQYKTTKEMQAVLYWFESATFMVNSTAQQKHVGISLIAHPQSLEDLQFLENQMVSLAMTIVSYWQPIKMWSQIAVLLFQYGANLATIASGFLAFTLVLCLLLTRKHRIANTEAYEKLSEENKTMIEAIYQTKKIPIAPKIATTYENLEPESLAKNELVEKMQQAQAMGLIAQKIISVQDEPILAWKIQLSLSK